MSARRQIVVVGAGSSGCVVAERLTRDARIDVILVEAGPVGASDHELRLSMLPIGPLSERVVHHTATQGFDLPRGRGLGGSSAVNGGYFMRWHTDDFAGWDQRWWDSDTIAQGYTDLDGGEVREGGRGGVMSVRRFADGELHPIANAFENHWLRAGYERNSRVTPGVGINRVRSNSHDSLRVSADRAHLEGARDRPNLSVRTGRTVDRLLIDGDRVTGVRLTDGPDAQIAADETILCAGTLGSAALIARSTGVENRHAIGEHRELLVRIRPSRDAVEGAWPLLQTVLHTADGMEIRCYNEDFARYIDGVPTSGPAIGVALMRPRGHGELAVDAQGGQRIDLGVVDAADELLMRSWAEEVVGMLNGAEFSGLVESGSATADPVILTSQHAWGALPMGTEIEGAGTDWTGNVSGMNALRVADGSILPTPGSSGPHETIMMVAGRIAETMINR